MADGDGDVMGNETKFDIICCPNAGGLIRSYGETDAAYVIIMKMVLYL